MGRPWKNQEGDLCEECGLREKAKAGYHLNGERKYRATCNVCHKARYERPWLAFRREECESCGYVPMFLRGLEVHHRDGDKENNDPENLMTLCSNCHKDMEGLIHELDGDYEKAESLLARFIKSLGRFN